MPAISAPTLKSTNGIELRHPSLCRRTKHPPTLTLPHHIASLLLTPVQWLRTVQWPNCLTGPAVQRPSSSTAARPNGPLQGLFYNPDMALQHNRLQPEQSPFHALQPGVGRWGALLFGGRRLCLTRAPVVPFPLSFNSSLRVPRCDTRSANRLCQQKTVRLGSVPCISTSQLHACTPAHLHSR